MPRKDPFKLIKVHFRIYDALKKRLAANSAQDYQIPSMNGYVEGILWDYALGKIGAKEPAGGALLGRVKAVKGEVVESPGSPPAGAQEEFPGRKGTRRHSHRT